MWAALATLLLTITSSVVGRVMTALGVGAVSYAILNTLASNVVSQVMNNYNSMGGSALVIVNLAGGGVGIGIILSSLVTRASLMAIKKMRVL